MKPTVRKKLKLKILEVYDSVKNFCDDIGYTPTGVSYILIGKSDGAERFWDIAREHLNIPEKDVYLYKEKT